MKKLALATAMLSLAGAVSAESFPSPDLPPSSVVSTQASGQNGFVYPARTHLDTDIIYHDVVFFYSNDMLSFFNNDIELLTKYIEDAVAINNTAFERQDIPLRRKIMGIVNIPDDLEYKDDADGSTRLTNLRALFNDTTYNYHYFFNASYVVALNKYYPDSASAIGLAEVSGRFAWFSPYRDFTATQTLAHELGHNDGLIHDTEHLETYSESNRRFLASLYAVGAECGNFDSIMKSGFGDRSEAFFSSPIVKDSLGAACGVENVSDVARTYMEALVSKIPDRKIPFVNNRPAKEATGTVSLSLPSTSVVEGNELVVEVVWAGAELGDTVQIITRKGTADLSDFSSTLRTVYFDGTNTVSKVSLQTLDDDKFEMPEVFTVELVYPNGVALDTSSSLQEVALLSDDVGNPGTINFNVAQLTLSEGQTGQLVLNRTGGVDGDYTLRVTTVAGTANANDFVALDQDVIFLNGETSKTISVSINSDTTAESAESFSIKLAGSPLVLGTVTEVAVTINPSSAPVVVTPKPTPEASSGSGGGSMGLSGLLLIAIVMMRRFGQNIKLSSKTINNL